MKQKNTVFHQEIHNQFGQSEEKVKREIEKKSNVWKKDQKEGQSEYRVEKKISKR